jgi:hypothetical protein
MELLFLSLKKTDQRGWTRAARPCTRPMEDATILRAISASEAALLLLSTGAVVCARFACAMPAGVREARADRPLPARVCLGAYNVAARAFTNCRLELSDALLPPAAPPKTTQFRRVSPCD